MQLLRLAVAVSVLLVFVSALPLPGRARCSSTATPEGDVVDLMLFPDVAVQVGAARTDPHGEDEEREATLTLDALLANVDEDYPGLTGLSEALHLRGRLTVLRPWLEARAARGSLDATVYRTLAVLSGGAHRALAPHSEAQTVLAAIL